MNPTIGVGMIARNAEATLRECLSSFSEHVDQIVVVLAGESTDKTEEVLNKACEDWEYVTPIQVYHFDWIDDFSTARNFAFSKLTTDWFCWFDADDVVQGAENLRQIVLDAEKADIGCLHFPYVYRSNDAGQPTVEQTRERLVKASLGWQWKYRVHEILVTDTPHQVGKPDNIRVIHKATENHTAQYLPILEEMYKEDPNDERTCGILADTYLWMQDFDKAIPMTERAFVMTGNNDVRWTHATDLARIYIKLQDWQQAEQWCFTAMSIHSEYSLPYLLMAAVSWFGYQDSEKAMQYFMDADQPFREEAPLHVRRLREDYTLNRWDVEWRVLMDQEQYKAAWEIMQAAARYRGMSPIVVAKTADPWFFNSWAVFEQNKIEDSVTGALAIVDHLCRRGDTLRARKLLEECLPLTTREDPRIVKAYERIRDFTHHVVSDDDTYAKFYEMNHSTPDIEDPVHCMNGIEYEPYRMNTILARLKARGAKRVLDVGCGAGAPALFLAEHGINVVGLDINSITVKEANRRARKVKTRGKAIFKTGNVETMGPEDLGKFDAVLMLELLEHIHPTKVPLYLSSAEDFLNPGGAVIATTPGMAIGDIPGLWQEFPRDHVQEFSRHDLEKLIMGGVSRRVKQPENLYRIYDPEVSVPGFASWFIEYGWCNPEDVGPNYDKPVTIYVGPGYEKWDPHFPDEKGLGGSETWAIKTAKELASRGHRVMVYAESEGIWDGVVYRHYSKFNPKAETWLCIVSRQLSLLDERPNAKHVLFVAHDVDYGEELTANRLDNMDRYCVLSEWHRNHTMNQYEDEYITENLDHKLTLFSNAIEPEFFKSQTFLDTYAPARVPHSFIWSSSPDRGLDQLLEWWPNILELWPDATLNIYYGWTNADAMMDNRPWLRSFKDRVVRMARDLPGVTWHGRIGQRELAQRAMETQFWVYPSQLPAELGAGEWHETFCITALEMQAAGVIPIMAGVGALSERFYFGSMSDGPLSLGFVLDELERLDKPDADNNIPGFMGYHSLIEDYNWPAVTTRLLDIVEEPALV